MWVWCSTKKKNGGVLSPSSSCIIIIWRNVPQSISRVMVFRWWEGGREGWLWYCTILYLISADNWPFCGHHTIIHYVHEYALEVVCVYVIMVLAALRAIASIRLALRHLSRILSAIRSCPVLLILKETLGYTLIPIW